MIEAAPMRHGRKRKAPTEMDGNGDGCSEDGISSIVGGDVARLYGRGRLSKGTGMNGSGENGSRAKKRKGENGEWSFC